MAFLAIQSCGIRTIGAWLLWSTVLVAGVAGPAFGHDSGVGGFSVTVPLQASDQQLPEDRSLEVTMRCVVDSDGHRISLLASHPGKSRLLCQSRCYFRTSTGLAGLMFGSAFVQPGAQDAPVRMDYFSDVVLSITHPGSFSCK